MYCIKCGQFLSGNAKFCSNCGARVEDSKTGESERIKVMTPAEDMEWDLRVFPSSRQKKTEDVVFDWGSDDLYKHSRYKKEQVNGTEDAEEGFKSSGFKFHDDDDSDNMFASVAGIFDRKKEESPEDNRLFNTIGYNSFFDKNKSKEEDGQEEAKGLVEDEPSKVSSFDDEEFMGFKGFSGISGFDTPVRDHSPSVFDKSAFEDSESEVEVSHPVKGIEFEPGYVDTHKSLSLSEDYLDERRSTYERNYFAADTEEKIEQKLEMDKARVFEDLDRKKSQLDAEFDKLIHPSLREDVQDAFNKERVAEILDSEEKDSKEEEQAVGEGFDVNPEEGAEAVAEAEEKAEEKKASLEEIAKEDDTIIATPRHTKKYGKDTMVYEKYSAPTIEDIKKSVKDEVKAEAKREAKEEVLEEAKAKAKEELMEEAQAAPKKEKKEKKLGLFARIKNFLAGDDDFEDLDDYQEEVPVSSDDVKNATFPDASDSDVEEISRKVQVGSDNVERVASETVAKTADEGQAAKAFEASKADTDVIDKFYTFNKKNEEFQQLLDKEYERIERKIDASGIEDDVEEFMDVHRGPMMEATSQIEEMAKAREAVFSGANIYIEGDNVIPQRSKRFKDGGAINVETPREEQGSEEGDGPTGVEEIKLPVYEEGIEVELDPFIKVESGVASQELARSLELASEEEVADGEGFAGGEVEAESEAKAETEAGAEVEVPAAEASTEAETVNPDETDEVVVEKYYIEEEKQILASIVYEPDLDKELQLGEEPVVDLAANIKVNETLAEALKEEDIAKLEAESASDEVIVDTEEEPKTAKVIIEPEKEKAKEALVVGSDQDEIKLNDIELVEEKSKLKWVIILFLVMALAIGGMMCVRYFSPQSMLSKSMDKITAKVMTLINHNHGEEAENTEGEEGRDYLVEDKTNLISLQIDRNLNDNIDEIVYAKSAKYDPKKEYDIEGLTDPKEIQDNTLYDKKKGVTRYVDEEIVGLMIAYASHREEYLTNKGGKVFSTLSSNGSLDQELRLDAAANKKEDITLLGIGDIKVDGDWYYVWTKEKTNGETDRFVYRIKITDNKPKIVERVKI